MSRFDTLDFSELSSTSSDHSSDEQNDGRRSAPLHNKKVTIRLQLIIHNHNGNRSQ